MVQLSDAKRDSILEASTRMFLAKGYSAVTMEAIANEAPVSKPTLYNYFPGKPALFAAVVSRLCTRMAGAIEETAQGAGDVGKDLQLISRAYVDVAYAPESLALYRVVIAELKGFPELGQLTYDSGVVPIINGISNYLLKVDPRVGVHFPQVIASSRLLIGMLSGDEFHRCLLDLIPTLTSQERGRLVKRVVDHFLRMHHIDG